MSEKKTVFELVCNQLNGAKTPFLLVGGYAVNAYGYSRQTFDVDFMIASDDIHRAEEALCAVGFETEFKNDLFIRLIGKKIQQMDVDLLSVDPETLARLMKEGQSVTIGNQALKIPSVMHLIALKLHAIKQQPKERESKDILDILEVIKKQKINVAADEFRDFCLKFGTHELYERILNDGK